MSAARILMKKKNEIVISFFFLALQAVKVVIDILLLKTRIPIYTDE